MCVVCDYAPSPTTLYSALFFLLFIIMYVVENKLTHTHYIPMPKIGRHEPGSNYKHLHDGTRYTC